MVTLLGSILRNAYTSYEYVNNLQSIEAIAVERELAGIPVARIPAEYLSGDATAPIWICQ